MKFSGHLERRPGYLSAALKLRFGVASDELTGLAGLVGRQRWIETSLANRHLQDATLILYYVSSSYLEGRLCPLAGFGYNRDSKRGKQQIVFGLLCAADGCPLAVEVFAGNTADPATVAAQVQRIRQRFGIKRIALVGHRGMLTTARIRADLAPAGLDWISALKSQHLLQAPLLFQDDDPAAARAQRDTPVDAAEVSQRAWDKARTKRTAEGFPAHSFPTLLGDLANLVLNRVRLPTQEQAAITIATKPTKLQPQAFDLLGIDPQQDVSITVTG